MKGRHLTTGKASRLPDTLPTIEHHRLRCSTFALQDDDEG